MSVALFDSSQLCSPSQLCSIPTMDAICVSTLHGFLMKVRVQPGMQVQAIKEYCIATSPFDLSALEINVDLQHFMKGQFGCIRLSTWDGKLLDDGKSLEAQLDDQLFEHDQLFKLVFMQQDNLSTEEMAMIRQCADPAQFTSGLIVTSPMYKTQFIVRPVFGGADRPNAILGIIYQHHETEKHCQCMECGVHPNAVHGQAQLQRFDLEVPANASNPASSPGC